MNAWLKEMYELFLGVFVRATPTETYTVLALCILLGAFALSRVSTGLGAIKAFYTTGIFLTASGLILLGAAMALPPVFGFDDCWMPMAAAALILLVIVLPLTVLFQKGRYVTALIGWIVALLTIGAVMSLEPYVMHQVDKYRVKAGVIEKHRIETERFK